ncbi:MAG: GAF domain-containing protein [Verrucomicrobiota bacterium]
MPTELPTLPTEADWTRFLSEVSAEFGCTTGTIHRLDPTDGLLKLVAAQAIPPQLIPVIQTIPVGKGIAGAAAERQEPVELCNLQTDTSGVAKPGAAQTQVQGSIAIPMMQGAVLRGTLGIGKLVPYEFTAEEKDKLLGLASQAAERL